MREKLPALTHITLSSDWQKKNTRNRPRCWNFRKICFTDRSRISLRLPLPQHCLGVAWKKQERRKKRRWKELSQIVTGRWNVNFSRFLVNFRNGALKLARMLLNLFVCDAHNPFHIFLVISFLFCVASDYETRRIQESKSRSTKATCATTPSTRTSQ